MGLLYIGGALQKAGYGGALYDAMTRFHTLDQVRATLRREQPDAVFVTCITATVLDGMEAGAYAVVVSNAVGTVTSATANLAVTAPPNVVEIVSTVMDSNQLFHLTLNVEPGFNYSLDASTNLLQWESITNFSQDGGLIDCTDPDGTNFWMRFYRLRWVP